MISIAPILTSAGQDMLIRALAGETLTFTTFKAGSGVLPAGSTGVDLTDLITPKFSFAISALEEGTNCVRINGHFDSQDVLQEFACTEIGLFAKIGNESAKLYGYVNNGTNAPIFKPNDSDVITTQDITFIVAVGAAQNVAAEIAAGTLYALRDHTHTVSEIIPGALDVSHGGTGVNSYHYLFRLINEMSYTVDGAYEDPAYSTPDDCDEWIMPGLYYSSSNTAHGPSFGTSRMFLVLTICPHTEDVILQFALGCDFTAHTTGNLFCRAGQTDAGIVDSWTTWKSLD